jgi:hemerythrin
MPILWSPSIAVGVPQIDAEHRELFARINRVLEALTAGQGAEAVAPLVGFLEDYVKVHFEGELSLMRTHRYVGSAVHLQQHQYFVNQFEALVKRYEQAGPSGSLLVQLNHLLCDWLREHVSTTDRQFGAFLQARGLGAPA